MQEKLFAKIPLLYERVALPKSIPASMQQKIDELKSQYLEKKDFLKACYEYLVSMDKASRIGTVVHFFELWSNELDNLWGKKKFLHCTQSNYLLRTMLVKSGLFKDSDIKLQNTNTWYVVPHQYVSVRVDKNEWIDVDVYAAGFGITFGDHSHDFHTGLFPQN